MKISIINVSKWCSAIGNSVEISTLSIDFDTTENVHAKIDSFEIMNTRDKANPLYFFVYLTCR